MTNQEPSKPRVYKSPIQLDDVWHPKGIVWLKEDPDKGAKMFFTPDAFHDLQDAYLALESSNASLSRKLAIAREMYGESVRAQALTVYCGGSYGPKEYMKDRLENYDAELEATK